MFCYNIAADTDFLVSSSANIMPYMQWSEMQKDSSSVTGLL